MTHTRTTPSRPRTHHGALVGLFSMLCCGISYGNVYQWPTPLESAAGATVKLSDYAGRATLLSFFFTRCQGACPQQARLLARLQGELTEATRQGTAILSISLDPLHDTPAAMANFAAAHDADRPHWTFARVQPASHLSALLERVSVSVGGADAQGQIDHRMTLLLVTPSGAIAQRYVADRFDVERVARELDTVMRLHAQGRLPTSGDALSAPPSALPAYLHHAHETKKNE